MKQITFTCLLVFVSLLAFSQTKFPIGAYAEGGLFSPKNESKGFTGGGGLFISSTFKEKLSLTLGAGYRYKGNKSEYPIPINRGGANYYVTGYGYSYHGYGGYGGYGSAYAGYGGYGSYPYGYDYTSGAENPKIKFNQHYFVLPFKVSYLFTKNLFIETGIETTWLLNYDIVVEKPEFNWLVGLGYQKDKWKASLSYTQGFDEQGMGAINVDNVPYGQRYKNRSLMVNLSYSIFDLKK